MLYIVFLFLTVNNMFVPYIDRRTINVVTVFVPIISRWLLYCCYIFPFGLKHFSGNVMSLNNKVPYLS